MRSHPRSKVATHEAAGKGGQGRVARVARPPMLLAMRHGMRPHRGAISLKLRSAGEARASQLLRTTRVGAQASPAPLRLPQGVGIFENPRPRGRRGVGTAEIGAPCSRRLVRAAPLHHARRGRRGSNKLKALAGIPTKLIPALQTCANLSPSRAPKRDHDEWLVRGRSGEGRVAALQAESTTAGAGSPVEPLETHGALNAECPRGQGRHA
jgi:hypothetical protein